MTGNPPGSPWRVTPRGARRRRSVEVTLAPETLAKLDAMAERDATSRSAIIDRLVREAGEK